MSAEEEQSLKEISVLQGSIINFVRLTGTIRGNYINPSIHMYVVMLINVYIHLFKAMSLHRSLDLPFSSGSTIKR